MNRYFRFTLLAIFCSLFTVSYANVASSRAILLTAEVIPNPIIFNMDKKNQIGSFTSTNIGDENLFHVSVPEPIVLQGHAKVALEGPLMCTAGANYLPWGGNTSCTYNFKITDDVKEEGIIQLYIQGNYYNGSTYKRALNVPYKSE